HLTEDGIDLRDPKISLMPDGRLFLLMGGSLNAADGRYLTRSPRVAFSEEGRTWTAPTKVLAEDHWLWRVTWHGDVG
ncbi:TPA: exo-alpha-sialidase, partial [Candidatus Latescibacteria bacterium]|nr:exo-alpha-sialidase [Candidatus Latescibacterota bacterium]